MPKAREISKRVQAIETSKPRLDDAEFNKKMAAKSGSIQYRNGVNIKAHAIVEIKRAKNKEFAESITVNRLINNMIESEYLKLKKSDDAEIRDIIAHFEIYLRGH